MVNPFIKIISVQLPNVLAYLDFRLFYIRTHPQEEAAQRTAVQRLASLLPTIILPENIETFFNHFPPAPWPVRWNRGLGVIDFLNVLNEY